MALLEERTKPITLGEMHALTMILTKSELDTVLRMQSDEHIAAMIAEAESEKARFQQQREARQTRSNDHE